MAACEVEKSGFSFENVSRNAFIGKKYDAPKPYKTGTTIAGIVFKDGVVLGADTRATEDTVVADKNCSKIHYLAENMYCCGAGTAADTEMTTQMISSQLQLHKLNTSRTPRVCTANRLLKQMLFRYQGYISAALVLGGVDVTGPHLYSIHPHGSTDKLLYVTMVSHYRYQGYISAALVLGGVDVTGPHLYSIHPHGSTDKLLYVTMVTHYRYQGYISAALVLGGVDVTGPHLYSIHPHGSTDKLPYVTMGSGSLAAMATFEDRFKPNMEKQDAMKLVRDAIAAGIFNDLGSGSNIDLCVITKDKVEFLRPYDEANLKGERAGDYSYKRGSTAVLTKDVQKIPFEVVSTEQMDTA